MKVAASDLYKVYKIYFITFAANEEPNLAIANLKTFKGILRLNSFSVKRANNRRGIIHGIQLNTTQMKEIFKNAEKDSELENWYTGSFGLRSEEYELM